MNIERKRDECNQIHTLIRRTLHKSISGHALRTRAHRNVIDNIAQSILSTCSRTRIHAFVSDACFIASAVIVYDTLRSTASVRITLVFRQARTYSVRALSVWSTRSRVAWIIKDRFFCYDRDVIMRFETYKDNSRGLRGGGLG